jgi:hypothetical protein
MKQEVFKVGQRALLKFHTAKGEVYAQRLGYVSCIDESPITLFPVTVTHSVPVASRFAFNKSGRANAEIRCDKSGKCKQSWITCTPLMGDEP